MIVEAGSEILLRILTRERIFALGEIIQFSPTDITEICYMVTRDAQGTGGRLNTSCQDYRHTYYGDYGAKPDHDIRDMNLDLPDEEKTALIRERDRISENDRFPMSPRITTLKAIRAKLRPEPVREPLPPTSRRNSSETATAQLYEIRSR
jgi:hypothetical protein